jgi:hypothetical protein
MAPPIHDTTAVFFIGLREKIVSLRSINLNTSIKTEKIVAVTYVLA